VSNQTAGSPPTAHQLIPSSNRHTTRTLPHPIPFSITVPSAPESSKRSLYVIYIFPLTHTCHMPCPSESPTLALYSKPNVRRGRHTDAVAPYLQAPQRQCVPRTNVRHRNYLLAAGKLNYVVCQACSDAVQPLWEACLSTYLPVCLPTCLPACLSVCLPVCLPLCLPTCLPACLSVCLSVCLPACLSAYLSVCLSACLPVCLPTCLPAYLSVCLSAYLSVCQSP